MCVPGELPSDRCSLLAMDHENVPECLIRVEGVIGLCALSS